MTSTATAPILFFDGECNLCNRLVQFIIRHDKKKRFLFASLQSPLGKEAVQELVALHDAPPDSFILSYNGVYYIRSSAALRVFRLLGSVWALLYAAIIVPRVMRDGVYNIVARNRYKWFGSRAACMVPGPGIMGRFLSK